MNKEPLNTNESFIYTDEDYALVLNIWRKELGFDLILWGSTRDSTDWAISANGISTA